LGSDTTYLRTAQGWAYLATVMDLYSRRIIGWSVSDHNDADLCVQALEAAIFTRGGNLPAGLIHLSDRGSTYASHKYKKKLTTWKIEQSMSAKGNCYDNAAMESFYGRFKVAAVGKITFVDVDHARTSAFKYIETFYNRFRRHSSLGYQSPVQFEEKFAPPMGGIGASLPACINYN
jgi:transposase InsO family protein